MGNLEDMSWLDVAIIGGVSAIIVPIVILVIWGLKIVREQEYHVVERFGKFDRVLVRGIRVLLAPGYIDKIVDSGHLWAEKVKLFTGKDDAEIDFTDASAPVSAYLWYHVADPDDVENKRWGEVKEQVRFWTYSFEEPAERVRILMEGALRPLLQSMSLDEARKDLHTIGKKAVAEAASQIEEVGAYLREDEPLVVEDIDIPADIQTIRSDILKASVRALAAKEGAAQYYAQILAIKKGLDESGNVVSFDRAYEIFLQQRSLEALEKAGANVTVVGTGIPGVMNAITLNQRSG